MPWARAESTLAGSACDGMALPRIAQVYVARRASSLARGDAASVGAAHAIPIRSCLAVLLLACVRDLRLEGHAAAFALQRLDAVGLVCRRPDGAAASRTRGRGGRRGRRRLDAVHVQGQAAVSALPHRSSAWRPKRSRWWRPACRIVVARRRRPDQLDRLRSPSRWSARSPPISSSTRAWSPARSRCRRTVRGGRCGTTSSSGARRASWWRAAPARSPRW